MHNIVGTPARGGDFFNREREIRKILLRIKDGNNLQIAAPRRIGKTSILFYLQDNELEGYCYVYVDTESIDNAEDFFKAILRQINSSPCIKGSNKLLNLFKQGANYLSKVKSLKAMGAEINFSEQLEGVNYFEDLKNFISGMELENVSKLIILIDEFPQTIININEKDKEDQKLAIRFLQSNRELRQDPQINKKAQFIYTGSIGLNHTVSTLNGTKYINDISTIEIDPLTLDESKELVELLCKGKDLIIEPAAVEFLLAKIEWLIPFHIQLAVQEIVMLHYETKDVSIEDVDRAFNNIVESRNHNHFEHYYSRLKTQFKGAEQEFVEEVLKEIATRGITTESKLYDIAVGYGLENRFKKMVEVLEYDGYINDNGHAREYQFNSPIVRMWWKKHIC